MEKLKTVTINQLNRYPVYLRYLKSIRDNGETQTSAPLIAKNLDLNEEQVRKDLQVVASSDGKPKSGRVVLDLINDIETFLGYNDVNDAVIIGVGHLGGALLNYKGFSDLGLNILAGFDNNPNVVGTIINNKKIYSLDKMENLIPRLNVQIAILTVPLDEAQKMADELIKIGIKAIWNFAPIHLEVPAEIVVENVNLASSLAVLSHKLKEKESK
jgi:AT-rich DNA-binding protein